jgi:transposase
VDTDAKEIVFLENRIYQLDMQVSILQKHLGKKGKSPRYSIHERLLILWYAETLQALKRKASRHLVIARSTLYRWLHKTEDQKSSGSPANRTPAEIAKANTSWGRIRIANQPKLLNILVSASTVRNILQRPKPGDTPVAPANPEKTEEKPESPSIPASHPNHVWPIDTAKVRCQGLWPIQVLVAIDPFFREVVCVAPLRTSRQGLGPSGAPVHRIQGLVQHLVTLEGLRIDDLHHSRKPEIAQRDVKTVPANIERHIFFQVRITAGRLTNAAQLLLCGPRALATRWACQQR